MPRPGQTRIAIPIAITLPPDVHAAFIAEAGEGYGARSALFRKMWVAYLDVKQSDGTLRTQLLAEKARTRSLLARLDHIRRALSQEGLL